MRSVLLYILLVGLPILAISGVLRAGQRLRSPIFVGGTWSVERQWDTDPDSSCCYSLISSEGTVLAISQSGSRLFFTMNDEKWTTFAGEIRGSTVTATIACRASNASSDVRRMSAVSIQLDATVERRGGSDRLFGTLTCFDCPTSTVTSFTALRQSDRTTQSQ